MVFPPGRRRLETLHIRPSSSNSYNAPYAPKKPHTISLPLVPKGEQKKKKKKEKKKEPYPQESHLASPNLYHKKKKKNRPEQNSKEKRKNEKEKEKEVEEKRLDFYFDSVRHFLKSPRRGFFAVVAVVGGELSVVGGEE